MIVKNERKEKLCCFYVSEFHLEMILLPHINKIIEENEEITILTEIKLRETMEILISKINLEEENKQKILKLEWDGEKKAKENSNIIIIGSQEYIRRENKKIENVKTSTIVDCYHFDEIKDNINSIVKNYKNGLNTLGKNIF